VKRRKAATVYLMLLGTGAVFFALVFTVSTVYRVVVVGLNPLQLVLVGTVLEASIFLFEVPTGVLADTVSRRISVIIGYVIVGIGFMIEASVPRFGFVLLAQVIWGLGYTFTSGALDAWMADEVGVEEAGNVFLRGSQAIQIGSVVGMLASGLLANVNVALPMLIGGVAISGLGVWLAFVMPEEGFTPDRTGVTGRWGQMGKTLRDGVALVRERPGLPGLVGVSVIFGLFSEGVDRLWAAHLLEGFTLPPLGVLGPVTWFGIIGAVSMLLSATITEGVRRHIDVNDQPTVARWLVGVLTWTAAGVIAFALVRSFPAALAIYWLYDMVRGVAGPLYAGWLNQRLEPGVRATVFSLSSQLNATGQIAGGPVIGWIGTVRSLRTALIVSGLLLLPSVPIIGRIGVQAGQLTEREGEAVL
jgi:DHA3 family tetracycline resistance protein-like MFS transporter